MVPPSRTPMPGTSGWMISIGSINVRWTISMMLVPTAEGESATTWGSSRSPVALIGMATDTRTVRVAKTVPEYYRSTNVFSPLDAVTTDDGPSVVTSFTSGTGAFADYFKITITQPYMYLVAAYDGPGGGAEVWYIGDISDGNVLYVPKSASVYGTPYDGTVGTGQNLQAGGTQSGLTSWSVWGTPGEYLLPDGGATAALLGLAMLGLGFIKRFRG